jgi:hypothetical protein
MAWLSGWLYRKELPINGSAGGAQTDYTVGVSIHSGNLGSLMPGNVATTDNVWGSSGGPYQRKMFYAKGRYWIFFADQTNGGYYSSSTDGYTWAAKTLFKAWPAVYAGYHISVVLDAAGNYVHIVYSNTQIGAPIYYRRGALNAAGNIVWDAEQTAKAAVANYRFTDPHIILDSNGYPWIAYGSSDNLNADGRAYAVKSSTLNGVWTTQFTQQINSTIWSSGGAPVVWAALAPLSGGKVYAIGQAGGEIAEGRLYDGGWGGVENVGTYVHGNADISVVADSSDNVFCTAGTTCLVRTYVTSLWSQESMGAVSDGQVTTGIYNDELYSFGEKIVGVIYQLCFTRRSTAGVWDSVKIARVYPVTHVVASNSGQISVVPYNNSFLFCHQYGAGSPWTIRTTFLPIPDQVITTYPESLLVVSCLNHAESDFGDIRFTASDGTTLLPYYFEYNIDNGYVIAWVKVDTIPIAPGSGTIYIYYGNTGAASLSDGDNTFEFWDDCETDLSKWTVVADGGSVTVVAKPTPEFEPLNGSKCILIDDPTVLGAPNITNVETEQSLVWTYRFRAHNAYADIFESYQRFFFDVANVILAVRINNLTLEYYDGLGYNPIATLAADTWFEFQIMIRPSVGTFDYYVDKILSIAAGTLYAVAVASTYQELNSGPNHKGQYYFDEVTIRKYVSPEPTWDTPGAEEYGIETFPATNIQATQADGNGFIVNATDIDIIGFDWGVAPGVYTDDVQYAGTIYEGIFGLTMSPLLPDTTYYFRVKAHSTVSGWIYGSELSFTTPLPLPEVETDPASNITDTSLDANGNITSIGGAGCDERGFVYDTASHGDPGNLEPGLTAYSNLVKETGSFGTGTYSMSITGLSPTLYYIRAFVHNAYGYDYGGERIVVANPNVNILYPESDYSIGIRFDSSPGGAYPHIYGGSIPHAQLLTTRDSSWVAVGTFGTVVGNRCYERLWYNSNMHKDLYTLTDPLRTDEGVVKIKWKSHLLRTTYPYGDFQRHLLTHGVEYDGVQTAIGATSRDECEVFQANPNTGVAWTIAELFDLIAGVSLGEGGGWGIPTCDYLAIFALWANAAVQTDGCTDLGGANRRLYGTVLEDEAETCTVYFEWGATVAYGNVTPDQTKAKGDSFTADINIGVLPSIHYRAVIETECGETFYGSDCEYPVPAPSSYPVATKGTIAHRLASDGYI